MQPRSEDLITTAIIHCAATPNGRFHDIDDVNDWHRERSFQRSNNLIKKHQSHLKHVGYHYVIRTDGALEFGRSLSEKGAHARGFNTRSVGICLIGTDKFTPAQWTTLKTLVLTLQQALPRMVKVIGHREVNNHKICPGFDVQWWIENSYTPNPKHILKTN